DPPSWHYLELAACHAYLKHEEHARRNLDSYLQRAKNELIHFPGTGPNAWRTFLEQTVFKRREDLEHFIEGVRRAGLSI
ncbi:MAG: hypothetical protein ACR2QH_08460, partial [Geminicoccaceae bacterium]